MDQGLAALLHGHARRRTGTVVKNDGPFGDHGLAFLVLRHDGTAVVQRHPFLYRPGDAFVIDQGKPHQTGADDFRHVALGRPQAAGGNDHIDAGQGRFQGLFHAPGIIADCRMINDRIADFIQFLR